MTEATAEPEVARMLADGWLPFEHEQLKPGVRVHNKGEQYPDARQFGTAEVVAVVRKPGRWEEIYGRLNLEVLVKYDPGHSLFGGQLLWWADYGTRLIEGCFHCGSGPVDCEHRAAWATKQAPQTTEVTNGLGEAEAPSGALAAGEGAPAGYRAAPSPFRGDGERDAD